MKTHRRKVILTVAATLMIPLIGWWVLVSTGIVGVPGKPLKPPFNMSDRIATIKVSKSESGEWVASFAGSGKDSPRLTADEFFEEVHRRQVDLPGFFQVLDVTSMTSLLWVLFGLAAQAIFAGRMIVQWYASEKAKASIVPNLFWWMSLLGSSMCIIYFIWRKEIVGIIGQSTGWMIYVRNLWMIYGKEKDCVK